MKNYWEYIREILKSGLGNRYLYESESGLENSNEVQPGIAPYILHYGMFETALRKLGSDEQYKSWKDDVKWMKMLGCYAQTELGHGSDISGLETTATLDL